MSSRPLYGFEQRVMEDLFKGADIALSMLHERYGHRRDSEPPFEYAIAIALLLGFERRASRGEYEAEIQAEVEAKEEEYRKWQGEQIEPRSAPLTYRLEALKARHR